jgi:hypothetical protein
MILSLQYIFIADRLHHPRDVSAASGGDLEHCFVSPFFLSIPVLHTRASDNLFYYTRFFGGKSKVPGRDADLSCYFIVTRGSRSTSQAHFRGKRSKGSQSRAPGQGGATAQCKTCAKCQKRLNADRFRLTLLRGPGILSAVSAAGRPQ